MYCTHLTGAPPAAGLLPEKETRVITSPSPATSRRSRRTTAWGLALAVSLTTAGTVALTTPTAGSATTTGDRNRDIAAAAKAYGVPASVLSAYSYAQTRWDDHAGAMSTDGGYGPAHLVDASGLETGGRDGGGAGDTSGIAARERLDTLGRAARLTGLSRDQLKKDPAANLRGAAALLAAEQRRLGRATGTGTDPAAWYGAVARMAPTEQTGVALADEVVSTLRKGAGRTTLDGKRVTLAPTTMSTSTLTAQRGALTPKAARRTWADPNGLDCPASLQCEWLPAAYEQTGPSPSSYGNHDLANRPASPAITTIVVHDTETPYDGTVRLVKDPTYLAWQYSLRSSDGHVAQHIAAKDIGWQAGNWYVNMHSIGLEHEGYAAKGGEWFSEPMYRSSAALVRFLADKYDIPLDRGHIIGHDQVPGTTTATTPGMHWDPGPYWDWEHYFDLIGAPLDKGVRNANAASNRPKAGDAVRVLPDFDTNVQPLTGCVTAGVLCEPQGSNIVPVRSAPDANAPLVNDIGLKANGSPATMAVSDWGGKASVGTDFAVAEVRGDWTAIWFAGVKGWVHNPASAPTLRVLKKAQVVTPKGAAAPTYGRTYPEAEAYPAGETPQAISPVAYQLAAGQSYVVLDDNPPTDYYKAKTFSLDTPNDHVNIVGKDRYALISLGHRVAYVRLADVDLHTVR